MADKNRISLKLSQIKELVKKRFRNRHIKTRPLCIMGHKGIGKTQGAKQITEELSKELGTPVECRITNLQFCEPPDFLGLPYVDSVDGQRVTRHARPELLPSDGFGIWFIDEFNRCNRDNRQGLITLIEERAVNGHLLGKDWIFILAGNPSDGEDGVSYETQEIDAALEDRICRIDFQGDVQEFTAYMVKRHGENHPVNRWVMNQPDVVDFKGKTRTSPRGLDYLCAAIAADGGMESSTVWQAIGAEIGMEAAQVFRKFLTDPEKISAEDILEKFEASGAGLKLQELEKLGRTDVLNTLVNSVTNLLVSREIKEEYLDNLVKYLESSTAETTHNFFLALGEKIPSDDSRFSSIALYVGRHSKRVEEALNRFDENTRGATASNAKRRGRSPKNQPPTSGQGGTP
jgi:hypothetical protein